MKLPHPLFDALIAWLGVASMLQATKDILFLSSLALTIISSLLGIYTAYRNLKRLSNNPTSLGKLCKGCTLNCYYYQFGECKSPK